MISARGRGRAALAATAAMGLVLALGACGGSSDSNGTTGSAGGTGTSGGSGSGGKTVKVGAALIGPRNDKSFNQATYEGIQAILKQHPNVELTSVLENKETDQQRTDAINTLGPIDDLVMAVSASFGPVLDQTAPKFPDTYFINVAGYTNEFHDNVTGFANDWGAPAYVGGVIAAHMTKTGTVGYVGGAEIPPTTQAAAAFKAGALSVDKNLKVLVNNVGDFNDVSKAKAATQAMIAENADVIFPFLDAGIEGSYEAGRESGKDPAMFKLTIPDCTSYDNIVGTELVNNKAAAIKLMNAYLAGTLKPGAIFIDLKDPEVQTLKLCPKYEKDPMVSKVTKETIDAMNSGKIKLPPDARNARPSYPHQEGLEGPLTGQ